MDFYKKLSFSFSFILLVVFLGFFRTYFRFLPSFDNDISVWIHIHAISMLSWLALLITQPLLIRYKYQSLHRRLGWFSPFVMFFVVLTTFIILAQHFLLAQEAGMPLLSNVALRIVTIITIISLLTFYVLAFVYRKNFQFHYRYMLGTGLAVIPAALTRVFYSLQVNAAIAEILTLAILNGIVIFLWRKDSGKNIKPNPYFIIFIFQMVLTTYYALMLVLMLLS
jgi:hypothetical protein